MVLPLLLPAAMGLAAEFAPGIVRMLAGDKAGEVAEKVVGVAQRVTGHEDPELARQALQQDPRLAHEARMQLAQLEVELERARLADVADARDRDLRMRQAGYRNTRADLMVAGAAGILIACLAALVLMRADLSGEAVGIISTVAGIAGACLKDAFGFEFGSSRGSKEKDLWVKADLRRSE